MPNYRRWRQPGGKIFLTVVTYQRAPLFRNPLARQVLHEAIESTQAFRPWGMDASVLLPDHLHMVWQLPSGDEDYSTRVAELKKAFTREFRRRGGRDRKVTPGQRRLRRRGFWQPRFWEHVIRDAADFHRHLNYIHYNPLKHELVTHLRDWPWSSFHRYLQAGWYEEDWAGPTDLPGSSEYLWME